MEQTLKDNLLILILIVLWTIPWKGWALWKAAQLKDKWWFVALLIVNTLGVLEIIYIFVFSRKKASTDISELDEEKK